MKIREKIETHILCPVHFSHKLYCDGFHAFYMQQQNIHARIFIFCEHFLSFFILRFLTAMTMKSSIFLV
jgi:hypothetical protein